MEYHNPVIIDAAARFAERQQSAEEQAKFLDLPEELRMVGDCIAAQPAKFFNFLQSCSRQVGDELQHDFGKSMVAKLVLDTSETTDAAIVSGVYYRENGNGANDPNLLITDRDVATMGALLEPMLIKHADEATVATKIQLATAAVCWLSLGGWAFDRLDPRRNGEIDESPDSYAFWADMVGLSSMDDEEDNPEVRQLIQQNAEVIKMRIAGSCVYFGIAEAGLASEAEIKAFQRHYFKPLFARQVSTHPETILPEHFALANPFTHTQVKELFVRLGLVQ